MTIDQKKKNLQKIKESQRKDLKEQLKQNGYWLGTLEAVSFMKSELPTSQELEDRIEKLTAKDIQIVGKKYLSGDYIVGMLMPE